MHNYSILFEIKFWLFSHIIDTTIEMIFHMHRFFFWRLLYISRTVFRDASRDPTNGPTMKIDLISSGSWLC